MHQISAWNAHPCFFAKKSRRGLGFLLLPLPLPLLIKRLTSTARHLCCEEEITGPISPHPPQPASPLFEHIWICYQHFPLKELNSLEFVSPHYFE